MLIRDESRLTRKPLQVRRLLLHVGLPKTGTSALQRWFHQNQAVLESVATCYPTGTCLNGDKHQHQFLVDELRSGDPTLGRRLSEFRHDTIVLSMEGLSNHFHDFKEAALQRFREETAAFHVEILLVTRERSAWLRSYHKQCVINPDNGASALYATALTRRQFGEHPRVRQLMDIPRLAEDLQKGFGARRVHLLDFEQDWFETILGLLSLDSHQCPPLPRVNESVPDWAVEVLRCLNGLGIPESRRIHWKRRLATFVGSNHLYLNVEDPVDVLATQALQADLEGIESALRTSLDTTDRERAYEFLASVRASLPRR